MTSPSAQLLMKKLQQLVDASPHGALLIVVDRPSATEETDIDVTTKLSIPSQIKLLRHLLTKFEARL